MSPRAPAAFWIGGVIALPLSEGAAFGFGGLKGLEGLTLGAVGSLFNLGALWAIIRLVSAFVSAPKAEIRGTFVIVLAFLVKLPLFIGMGVLANRIGGPAMGCFLVGVALVYSALVGWMLASR